MSRQRRQSFDDDYKETFIAYVERGGYRFAKESRKRGEIRRATPAWSNLEKLRAIYRRCAELNRGARPGIEYHVLHVIPVRNKKICGLHVDWNLRIGSRSFMEVAKFDQDQESERYFQWLKQQGL